MDALHISVLDDITALTAPEWDGCNTAGNPFVSHRFLAALEQSGSVGRGTGWHPQHLVVRQGGVVTGVAPMYLKTHSQGEYIFDFAWADAYDRAGGQYYPKLQIAVPFTPVTGPRLIARDMVVREAMLDAIAGLVRGNRLSSAHVTFCNEAERMIAQSRGWLGRTTMQYHWLNAGYRDYEDFLAALSSRKRKALRKERERAQAFGGVIRRLTGAGIRPEHWDAFWRFYQDTGSRKWGRPYLTRAFFDALHQNLRDDVVLVLAERDGVPIAGALNFRGGDALYGRYWGCVEDHPFLHFELCYHQAIEFAIEAGLSRVEAGAQGDHKLARGYMPVPTHSAHYLADPRFARAVAAYLEQEGAEMGDDIASVAELGPFRRGDD